MCASDKQTEDRPKSPSAAAIVDPSLQEVVQQEVEKPIEGSTTFAWEILGYHSTLVVSSFFILEYFLLSCRVLCFDLALLAESGQSSRGAGRVPSSDWRGYPADG